MLLVVQALLFECLFFGFGVGVLAKQFKNPSNTTIKSL